MFTPSDLVRRMRTSRRRSRLRGVPFCLAVPYSSNNPTPAYRSSLSPSSSAVIAAPSSSSSLMPSAPRSSSGSGALPRRPASSRRSRSGRSRRLANPIRRRARFRQSRSAAQKELAKIQIFGESQCCQLLIFPGFAGTPARLPWRVLCFWFLVSPEGFGRDAKSVRVTRESDDASDSCPSDCKNHRNIRHDRASVATARYAATAGRSRRPTQTAWAARPAGAVMRGVSRSGLHR
jgi:hypothetical protein